jgi:FlgD Ig-like domain/CARDB
VDTLGSGTALMLVVLTVQPLLLASADQPDRRTPPQDVISRTATVAIPPDSTSADTSMWKGSGVNITGGPIIRHTAQGSFRKDPGARAWVPVGAGTFTDAQLRERAERERRQALVGRANDSCEIVINVPDSTALKELGSLRIAIANVPPCTLAVRLPCALLDSLHHRSILFWWQGQLRPGADNPRNEIRKSGSAPQSEGSQRRPPVPVSSRVPGDRERIMVQLFSDDFESNSVPGSNWTAYDNNSVSGSDYWGDNHFTCGPARSGNWSVQCARNGGSACGTYDANQDANMDLVASIDMSSYEDVTVTSHVFYDITDGNFDYFETSSSGTGGASWSGGPPTSGTSVGWVPINIFHDNASGSWNNFKFRFRFFSDGVVQSGSGVYVDDVVINATPRAGGQPNLTSYTPSGWSGPIVPSSVPFTTTTGTLYSGQTTYVDFAIRNASGTAATNGFWVDYYLDNVYQSSDFVSGLAGNTAFTRTDLSLSVASSGNHVLKMVIDPFDAVTESTEGDNVYEQTFFWNPPPYPDLIVQSVTVTPPSPTVSTTADVSVTIKNQGTVATDLVFPTDFYNHRSSAPTVGQTGDATHSTTIVLNPGTTETFHFFPTSAVAATWSSWVQVDRSDIIEENANEGNNVHGPIAITWVPGSVTVSGTFAYDDSLLGLNRPLRCVRVVLYDRDAGGASDDSLSETYTNATGQWGPITLSNRDSDPGSDQGLLDLYARVYFTTRRLCLGDSTVGIMDYYGDRWYFDTPVVTNIANGSHSFGTVKPTTYGTKTAAHLYATILRGYDYLKALGTAPPFVFVRWTPGDGFVTAYVQASNAIFLMGGYSHITNPMRFWPDEWDDGIVLHEYGHHIARAFNYQHIPPGPYSHSPDTVSTSNGVPSREAAWAEGAAWYFACQVLSTPVITNWGDSLGMKTHDSLHVERGIYWDSVTLRTVNVNDRGDTWEVANTGVLWDIADAVNDNPNGDWASDHLTSTGAAVWDVLRNPGDTLITNVYNFYNVYQPRYADRATQSPLFEALNQVYCEHGMCPLVVDVPDEGVRPLTWGRVRNQPNPFQGSTRIVLSVPITATGGASRLQVFDVTGHLVRTLVDRPLEAGEHFVRWDGRSQQGSVLPAGVYYGKLDGPGTRQTFKLLLLR